MPNNKFRILDIILWVVLIVVIVSGFIFLTSFGWKFNFTNEPVALTVAQQQTKGNLQRIVSYLSVDIGVRNYHHYSQLTAAAKWITSEFEQLGYEVSTQTYKVNGQEFQNIIAVEPGANSTEPLIVGAHYDSCFNPGADDNASAVAGMLELARLLKGSYKISPFRFVAFVNEEPPFFHSGNMGSMVYAKSLRSNNVKLRGAVVLEMIGYYSDQFFSQRYLPLLGLFYPNKADFITLVGDPGSQNLANTIFDHFKASTLFPVEKIIAPNWVPGINFSDHWSFWENGYSAVMITDTAFLRNPNYHQRSDLPATLNYSKMTLMLDGLKEAILKMPLSN